MTRLILLAVYFAAICAAQILPPLIGHVRDRAGQLVPVYGVAGTFTLGKPMMDGVLEAAFAGTDGLVRTVEGWFAIKNGEMSKVQNEPTGLLLTREEIWIRSASDSACRRLSKESPAQACPEEPLTIGDFTSRLELPEPATSFERIGADWYVLRGERGLYAVRWRPSSNEPQLWQLPEAEVQDSEDAR